MMNMKWSNCGVGAVVVVVAVILLCFGQPIKSTQRCFQPDILYSYLGDSIIEYNRSYPYVDASSVLHPVLDLMLGLDGSGYEEPIVDLLGSWIWVCWAKDLEEEHEAWKVLAREMIHRLHIDQSVYRISTRLFGDRMGAWLLKPHLESLKLDLSDRDAIDNCVHELELHHTKHCGPLFAYGLDYLMTFEAMCRLGLKGREYADAAQQVCKDYVYISNPRQKLLY